MSRNGPILIIALIVAINTVNGFPDGAPVDACVKERPNQPYHAQIKPQPAGTSPYQIVQSSRQYAPGTQVTVTLRGGSYFKGFFIQARDSKTHNWIGTFAHTPNTKVHDECSAVTHADPKEKEEAALIWNAPTTGQGQVYFTGSMLKEYDIFWADLVSQ
ncbi:reelin domain-containing protein 1 [Diachasma alloeum]|uniref:reelin domain-containing protein 1 n=1 Tax=Diachasma alloeum TaxID=454923 RepID=UPI000738217B|nr:reelin domain-containing protein 1 [Diachasma alloeum]